MKPKTRYYQTPYRQQLISIIQALPGEVFSRQDVTSDQSNREQLRLNRALKMFLTEGMIIKISHGLYAKAKQIKIADEEHTILRKPFEDIAIEALNKRKVHWELGRAIQEYNSGESQQIPVVFTVRLHTRFRSRISAIGRELLFEGGINAR